MKRASVALIVALSAACSSQQPVRESTLAQVASGGGCEGDGQTLVTAYVNRAYENTVVIWDGNDPRSTVAVNLPRPGFGQRMRGVFGETKNQVTAQQLSELASQRTPVMFGLQCQGDSAPQVRSVRYTDSQGQRVAIAY